MKKMNEKDIVLILILLLGTIVDLLSLKKPNRKLSIIYLACAVIISGICNCGVDAVFGMLLGAGFLVIAKLTDQAIGYMDGILLLCIGLFYGWREEAFIFCIAVGTAGVCILFAMAAYKLWNRKLILKNRFLPFVPFLLFADVVSRIACN